MESDNYNYIGWLSSDSCKLLVVGGGSGGCAMAAKFARSMTKKDLIIVEPSDIHYYQPMFTLIGGGIKKLTDSGKATKSVLPSNATWLKDRVVEFFPEKNQVITLQGDTINYDFMLIAVGLQLNYEKIPGLIEALNIPNTGVCSNYSPKYVNRTYEVLQKFESGNAIFTFPNTPIKCPGAPQKICYITEDYLRRHGKRDKTNIIYNTSLPVIFGVKKYADALWKLVEKRNIKVNLRTNLIEVKPKDKVAVFQSLDIPDKKSEVEFSMLHVTPPMSAPDVLSKCTELVNATGFVNVNKDTLQHVKYPNVFAIGDCSGTPNSKTAASVAAQTNVVYENMKAYMANRSLNAVYNGYASCPLVTGYGKCILAEFDYDLNPLETFPISQDKEMWVMYSMKKDFMPPLYWHLMLNGRWNGPSFVRNLMHFKFGG
ncbi:hypothetical protein FQA39_LY11885 [Lamprigera yunnana]|nr:hypothetical protein FQA39_LY11885 [Lamprigera yunnana]